MTDDIATQGIEPGDVLTISQTSDPHSVRTSLLISAIREGWIVLLVNFNAAVFFGIILVAADIDAFDTLTFLIVQILTTTATVLLWFFLLAKTTTEIERQAPLMRNLVQLGDAMIMAGWGGGILLIYDTIEYERTALLVILLMAPGVATSALSAKLIRVLIGGRAILFLPSFIYLLWQQPPLWGIHSGMLVFAFCFSIGVGYAVHIQHLRVANLNIGMKKTGDRLALSLENERLNAQKSLNEAALRERFLRSVTHDLRQPINALKLFIDDIARGTLNEHGKRSIVASQSCLRSTDTIIESVSQLAWLNDKTPAAAPVDLPLLPILRQVRDEIEPQAREKSIEVRLVESNIWCRADPHFLERILRNLAHNALQYTEAGRILIGVRHQTLDLLEVWFCDTGKGIPPEEIAKIFRAYHRVSGHDQAETQSGNIGLGLSIVRELSNAMGGSISVSSEYGKGSIFRLRIPRARVNDARSHHRHIDEPVRLDGKRLLVVDDDRNFVSSISSSLRQLGAEVTGISAIDDIRTLIFQEAPEHDIAILDFDFGEGLTALELLGSASGVEPEKAIIVTLNADIARAHLRNFAGLRILSKTARKERLHQLLYDVLANTPRS